MQVLTDRFAELMKERAFPEAAAHARKAVEREPDNPRYRWYLCLALGAMGGSLAALEHLDAIIGAPRKYHQAQPGYYLKALERRGKLYAWLGRFAKAAADLMIVVKMEPARAEFRMALAEALIEIGKYKGAEIQLRQAAKLDAKQTAKWSYLWGRLKYRLQDYMEAKRAFEAALSKDPNDIKHYISLSAASCKSGNFDQAHKITQACFKRFPVKDCASDRSELWVLVLEHFGAVPFGSLPDASIPYTRGNFIAGMPRGRIAYTHAAIGSEHSVNAILRAKKFGLIVNNCATAEGLETRDLEALDLISDQLQLPVINSPAAVAQSTRLANAQKFASSERFIFPRTIRIARGVAPSPTAAQVLENLKLPIILRPVSNQQGRGAKLVRTPGELENELMNGPSSDLYAIEFHDCATEDGLFRKYRMAVIDGQLTPVHLDVATNWNVHSSQRRSVDWDKKGLERQEKEFCAEPGTVLGVPPDDLFGDIVKNTELDVYGIDFGRRRDGRIVVFEINAAMAFNSNIKVSQYPYLLEQRNRIVNSIERLFFERSKAKPDRSA